MSPDAYAKRMGEIYSWATRYVAEDDSEHPIDFFLMTPPVASLLSRIVVGSKGLFFLVGHQGTGKTRTLMSLSSRLRSWDLRGLYIRWSSRPTKDDYEAFESCDVPLIDLPDYGADGAGKMMRHLDLIGERVYYGGAFRKCVVIAVQKELFGGHYLRGKGEVFELKRLRPEELVKAFKMRFGSCDPFSEEFLMLVASMSGGVFRRFQRYLSYCIEESFYGESKGFTPDLVRRAITVERMVAEMDLELGRFLVGRQRLDAVRVLEFVRGREGVNQKEVSGSLGLAEAYVSRLIGRLEAYGYLGRRRGRRKEWIIESSLDIR